MPTRRFERIALAQLLVGGCAVVFGLIELAQAQVEYEQPLVHHHLGRNTGLAWPDYCGSSPCVRIHPRVFYGYAAPYASSTLWWPGFYDYAAGNFGRGHPRYLGYPRPAGYHGD